MHGLSVLLSGCEQREEFHERRRRERSIGLGDRFVELLFPYFYEVLQIGLGELHPAHGTRIDCGEKDAQTRSG